MVPAHKSRHPARPGLARESRSEEKPTAIWKRTSLRSLVEARPFVPRAEESATQLDSSAKPFVPQPWPESAGASASNSTTASGCSSPRSVCDQELPGVQALEFPFPLREKNTFLDFDIQGSPAAVIRSAKSAPDLLAKKMLAEEIGSAIARRQCWADMSDDEADPPLPSAGSAGHDLGDCKPCAFVHKPRGCSLAADCPFCHLCAAGEKRKRQKEKRATFARRERDAAAVAAPPPVPPEASC